MKHVPRGPVLLLLILSGLGWGFFELAGYVIAGEPHRLDTAILRALRHATDLSDPLGPVWLEKMARDVTALGGSAVLTLLIAGAGGTLWLAGERRPALLILGAALVATATSKALKAGFDRPRPDLVPHEVIVTNASFPSGHSLMAAAVYLTLGLMLARASARRRVRVFVVSLAVLTAVIVGASRVYLGVHWPSDVLGGWALGSAIALVCGWLAARRTT